MKKFMLFFATIAIALVGLSFGGQTASAKASHTVPSSFYGTWYGHKDHVAYKITFHKHYAKQSGYTLSGNKLYVRHFKFGKHTGYNFYPKSPTHQARTFVRGTVKYHGKKIPALIADSWMVYTHYNTKHQFSVPKGY